MTRLLHLTDIHFWRVCWNPLRLLNKRMLGNANVLYRRRKEFVQRQADVFGDYVVSLGVPDVLISGDFTSTALEEEFAIARAWVDRLREKGLAVTVYAGNHDVYTFESVRTRRFQRHFGDYLPDTGPMPWRIVLPGGTPLILAPTVCPNFFSSKGRITNREAAAVAERIAAEEGGGPILVSGHYPVLHETYAYRSAPERQLRNAGALRRAMGESGKRILYIAGHVHRFSYLDDPEHPNLRHLTTGAFFRHDPIRQRQGEFTEIRVEDGEFQAVQHVYYGEWRRTEAAPHGEGAAAR